MSDDGRDSVRVTHRVPEHIRDAAQSQTRHGEMSEMVRDLYESVGYGTGWSTDDSLELELERVRAEKDSKRASIKSLQNKIQVEQSELDKIEKRETRIEERLVKQQGESKYEGHIESLESLLHSGVHVWIGHPTVKTAANAGTVTQQEVIEHLQDENPEIPPERFEEKLNGGR